MRVDPIRVRLDDVQVVVLPYFHAGSVLGSLAGARRLAPAQTQTAGFDGVRETVGPEVAIARATGVRAAASAELAIGLALASLTA